MVTQEELRRLLSDLESDRIERTRSTRDTDKFARAVCAFANDLPNHRAPGYLIVGVDDDGLVAGLEVTDELLQRLAGLRSDGNIQPLPAIAVAKFEMEGGQVAVVEVQPSDLPPVRYKGQIWIRVGPRQAVASEHEERILTERRVSCARTFDATPMVGTDRDDLSLPVFSAYRLGVVAKEVVEANHRTIEEQLASLRFYDLKRGCPTVAGILLFGKNPRFHLPGAYVQYLQLPGTTLAEMPEDQAEIAGDLLAVLRELVVRINVVVHTGIERVSTLREVTRPDYPEVAVRELLLNAILHRDYQSNTPVRFYVFSDRIEIQSPGGLYGEVTPDTMTRASSYRNPVLAEAMKALGYVNRFGYGIQRAEAALRQIGSPPPDFQIDDRTFLAIIQKRRA